MARKIIDKNENPPLGGEPLWSGKNMERRLTVKERKETLYLP